MRYNEDKRNNKGNKGNLSNICYCNYILEKTAQKIRFEKFLPKIKTRYGLV